MALTISHILDDVDNIWIPNSLTSTQKVQMLNQIEKQLFRETDFPNAVERTYLTADVALYNLPADCPADRIRHVVYSDGTDEAEYPYKTFSVRVAGSTSRWYTIFNDTKILVNPTPTLSGATLKAITVSAGGSGYTSAPTVAITGGGGSGATATATVSSGAVTVVTITATGTDYITAPTISFSGGGGSGATATATIYEDSIYIYFAPQPTEFTIADLTVTPSTPADYHQYYVWRLAEYVAKSQKDVTLANNFAADADDVLDKIKRQFSSQVESGFQMEANW
jgi:hypothetical protein